MVVEVAVVGYCIVVVVVGDCIVVIVVVPFCNHFFVVFVVLLL